MNAYISAQNTYSGGQSPSRSPKSVEYDALAKVTQQLKLGLRDKDQQFSVLAQAIFDNLRLWGVFAADLASPQNGLPPQLRGQLGYLFEFTHHHSQKVLAREASPEVLIEINTAVMRGLRGNGGPKP